jgi:hypothetical protein
MKKNFLRTRWFFTMLLFVTTMIMPSMMWAQSITPTQPKGEGTLEKPYQIGTAAELYWFAGLVNGTLEGVEKNASADAILTTDITVNNGVLDANKDLVSKSDFIEWTPIGTSRDNAYTGTFDGKGYTVSGLYFNNPIFSYSYVGLFGYIGANGKISNVGVLDSYFQFRMQGGGICGKNDNGELQNCSNSSTVIGNYSTGTGGVCGMNYGTVRDCKNTGSVRGPSTIGGVCGFNNSGKIENCFNEGIVSGTDRNIGGVCGNNDSGTTKCCYNTASVSGLKAVGGVCGSNSYGTITNCFNEGTVSGKYYVGGVCGDSYGSTTNCYYLSGTALGGIEGQDVNGSAEKKSIKQFKSGEVAYLLAEGKVLGEQAWGQQLGKDPYPVLGSDYKVIKAAKGDKDVNGHYTYWATFSNLKNDVTLSVPSDRSLNVYNATVSGGKLTLTQRSDDQVAMDEGVLLKTDGEYVNAKVNKTNELTAASSDENNLVATPAEANTVTETDYILYRLTYNDAKNKDRLGFYLGVDKATNSYNGTRIKTTPGKAYLKVSENEAKAPSSAALTRSFVFGGGSETTGIDEITIMGTDVQRHGTIEGIFDLQGRKIVNPTKGIYIKNNKKVIIK